MLGRSNKWDASMYPSIDLPNKTTAAFLVTFRNDLNILVVD